ncbi:hypothetical protein [Oceanobacillus halophilus]|uniref:Uncharacterized protein n=1 Tax=Oceanobacillus halophilus TaxID=930130 RepID=A0A494ZTU9_9BACI|nr:hypothetical protein [Oceanobacillus halophilus]RKQ29663.1 hypothetical protein D8M06_17175 [Oceanobacillus halophilus]
MSRYYYDLCNRHRGKAVEITTRDGRKHRGIIRNVDQRRVFIQPLGGGRRIGGFGYGFYGYGPYGYRPGFGYGVALGAIATLALLPWFWI